MTNAKQTAEYAEMHLELIPTSKAKKGVREKRRPKTGLASVYKTDDENQIQPLTNRSSEDNPSEPNQDQLGTIQIADISDGLIEEFNEPNFEENKDKIKNIMSAVKDYQDNPLNVINFQDFNSLSPTDKDAFLKNVQTKHEQNFNSLKVVHDSDKPLSQHYNS